MVRQLLLVGKFFPLGVAVIVTVVTGNVPVKAVPIASAPASALESCRSTALAPPTNTQLEVLQMLRLKYKVAASDIAINKATITRCQFASLFSALSDRVNEVIASDIASANTIRLLPKEDLLALQQLQTAYATELAYYPSEFASNGEARTVTFERQMFKGNSPIVLKVPISTNLSGEWILEPQFNEPPLPPLPPLPSNGNALAAPADVQALNALTERHGCLVGIAVPRSYQPRRFAFAAALNACIDRFDELLTAGTVVSQADLSTLHRLEAAYAGELAYLRGYLAQLEERVIRQAQQQAFEADLLATLKLPSTIKLSSDFLSKPKPSHIRTEPTPPPAQPNAGKPAALADFQAFAPVVQRYGCVGGFFDQFSDKLTRIEFAAALNNCVDRVNDLVIGGSVVRQEDLLTLKRLEASYSGELAVLRFRIDALEARIKQQEQQPFSPTTKLHVETVLELSGTAGGNR